MGGSCSRICDPALICFACIKRNSSTSEDQEEILHDEYRNQSVQDNLTNQSVREDSRIEMGASQSTSPEDISFSPAGSGSSQSRSSHRHRGQDLSNITSDDIMAGLMMRFAAERQRQSTPVVIERSRGPRPGPSSVSHAYLYANSILLFRVPM